MKQEHAQVIQAVAGWCSEVLGHSLSSGQIYNPYFDLAQGPRAAVGKLRPWIRPV